MCNQVWAVWIPEELAILVLLVLILDRHRGHRLLRNPQLKRMVHRIMVHHSRNHNLQMRSLGMVNSQVQPPPLLHKTNHPLYTNHVLSSVLSVPVIRSVLNITFVKF
jgi:hypothetical protein